MITMGRRKAQGRGKPKQNQDLLPLSAPLGMLKDELLALQASCSMARGGGPGHLRAALGERGQALALGSPVRSCPGPIARPATPCLTAPVFSSHRFRRTVDQGNSD